MFPVIVANSILLTYNFQRYKMRKEKNVVTPNFSKN